MTDARWPDGCPKTGHVRDAICALGKVEMPPPAEEPEPKDDRGGST